MLHAPVDAALEVVDVSGVLAHALAFNVGDLGYVLAVAGGGLHDDVQGWNLGVVGDVGSDAESNLGLAVEVSVDLACALEVKAVGEQKGLGARSSSRPTR